MNGQQAQALEKGADNMPLEIGFKRLSENAVLPTKAHASDSGFDIYAAEDVIIAPGDTIVVATDIAVVLPRGFDASVRPRSGITSKTKLRVQYGTIDNSYTGAIGIIVDNIYRNGRCPRMRVLGVDNKPIRSTNAHEYEGTYQIYKGDKIAQLVVQPIPDTVAVEVFGELGESERGESGFGSSGTN